MFDILISLTSHIVPFMSIMGQVVTIWGFLNFMNQLNLQNITIVADRALGRISGLRSAIFALKNCQDSKVDELLESINEIVKRLNMDLKQLGIAKKYDMKHRISLLSEQSNDDHQLKINYLNYELGSDWYALSQKGVAMKIPFLQKLEDELLNIFDLSHAGQTFINHLSTNVIRITWVSIVLYLLECQLFVAALCLLLVGVIALLFDTMKN